MVVRMTDAELTSQPQFRRIWILQEIGTDAPATLFWGKEEVSWVDAYEVSNTLREYFHQFTKQYRLRAYNLTYLYRRFVENDTSDEKNRLSFPYQQHRARHLQATDPRDFVFALLGHHSARVASAALAEFRADYTLPAAAIYRSVAIRLLKGAPTLEVLNVIQHRSTPNGR
jgi:hypothetical protein